MSDQQQSEADKQCPTCGYEPIRGPYWFDKPQQPTLAAIRDMLLAKNATIAQLRQDLHDESVRLQTERGMVAELRAEVAKWIELYHEADEATDPLNEQIAERDATIAALRAEVDKESTTVCRMLDHIPMEFVDGRSDDEPLENCVKRMADRIAALQSRVASLEAELVQYMPACQTHYITPTTEK